MFLTIATLCLATMMVALPLLRLDFPFLEGQITASGAGERWSLKIFAPLLLIGGVFASAMFSVDDGNVWTGIVSGAPLASVAAIGLSSLAAVLVSTLISRFTSISYAFIGAIFGYQLMMDGSLAWPLAGRMAASWIAAPVICALLAALVCRIVFNLTEERRIHLAISDHRLLLGCIISALLLAGAAGWNLGRIPALFPSITLRHGPLAAGIAAGITILLYLLAHKEIASDTGHIADQDLDLNAGAIFAILLSNGLTFLLFSSSIVRFIGMTPTPLSAPALMIAALFGCSLARKKAYIDGADIAKSILANAVSPILGILICYSVSMILTATPNGSAGRNAQPTAVLIILGIVAVVAALYIYFRGQRRNELRDQIIRSREQQTYNAQKSLSALEVRAEMTEKELLAKLETKQKELVDFAVGISDQKEYMEGVYERLSEVRKLGDPAEKDAATDELLSSLRERMYFTREMNDFYAQTEILHRDFNMRLKESFPNLTESERKLANLLRQGFSSKYIASLMNITPKSVEISRYRLRTKLGLQRSDNLVKFIKSI